jgi:protein-S-isoprenylcysteine O-methyltransferase Ste14
MGKDAPLVILAVAVVSYWGTIGLLSLRHRWQHGQSAGIIPHDPFERRLWCALVPAVVLWFFLPLLALESRWFGLPAWTHHGVAGAVRGFAAAVGVVCYLLSVYSWLGLGRHWSMAIVPGQTSQLVTAGAYRWVRHPIYALSIGLMLASLVVVPTLPMLLAALVHVTSMNLKARHEEEYLGRHFGPAYEVYCQRVARFWPRRPAVEA